MKITINTKILRRYNLSLEEFLVLLASHYNTNYDNIYNSLVTKGYADKNLFKDFPPILSDNTKNIIARVLMESDDRVINCDYNIDTLASTLQQLYPNGIKSGKTYTWRGETDEIAQKLRTLIVKYDFQFTEEEAINATKEYVESFKTPYQYMHTLRNFLLYTKKDSNGHYEMESIFMTIIENNRDKA